MDRLIGISAMTDMHPVPIVTFLDIFQRLYQKDWGNFEATALNRTSFPLKKNSTRVFSDHLRARNYLQTVARKVRLRFF